MSGTPWVERQISIKSCNFSNELNEEKVQGTMETQQKALLNHGLLNHFQQHLTPKTLHFPGFPPCLH